MKRQTCLQHATQTGQRSVAILITMGGMGQKEKDMEHAEYAWRVWVRSEEKFPSFLPFVCKSENLNSKKFLKFKMES